MASANKKLLKWGSTKDHNVPNLRTGFQHSSRKIRDATVACAVCGGISLMNMRWMAALHSCLLLMATFAISASRENTIKDQGSGF
jgi:hypothetical protein